MKRASETAPLSNTLLEVERIAQIIGRGITRTQGCQAPTVLYQREDRARVIDVVIHKAVLCQW
jgi:hypothetical protein